MTSTWLPVYRSKERDPRTVTSVKCPRKGPIPSEISLLKCGQLYDGQPERCADCRCTQALQYAPQLAALRGVQRRVQQSSVEQFASRLSLVSQTLPANAASVSALTSSSVGSSIESIESIEFIEDESPSEVV